jgi:hypothetical protein
MLHSYTTLKCRHCSSHDIASDDMRDNLGVLAMDIGVVRMLAVVTLH